MAKKRKGTKSMRTKSGGQVCTGGSEEGESRGCQEMSYKLTIESDDPTKIQTLVLLADVLLKGQDSYVLIETIEPAMDDFMGMLADFVSDTQAFPEDAEPLKNMAICVDRVALRMRSRAKLLTDVHNELTERAHA